MIYSVILKSNRIVFVESLLKSERDQRAHTISQLEAEREKSDALEVRLVQSKAKTESVIASNKSQLGELELTHQAFQNLFNRQRNLRDRVAQEKSIAKAMSVEYALENKKRLIKVESIESTVDSQISTTSQADSAISQKRSEHQLRQVESILETTIKTRSKHALLITSR
jgi:hypothetical protein